MTSNSPGKISGGLLSGRRLVLLGTTILSLGAAALIVAPDAARHGAFAQNVTSRHRRSHVRPALPTLSKR